MTIPRKEITATTIRDAAHPLSGDSKDYNPLMDIVGDSRFTLIGEASHGTHEFYDQRIQITKRLIIEKGFTVVAVEADWPSAYRVNRYVHGTDDDKTGEEALSDFERFPTWMWRNTDVLAFIEWLRAYNTSLPSDRRKVGFYGLDLYSLHASIAAVLAYLDKVDPEAAKRARERYACFDHFGGDPQSYGFMAGLGLSPSCEQEVISVLLDLLHHQAEHTRYDDQVAEDEFFYAEQNARLVKDAETYYRSMFSDHISSWNIRDRHMADTLDALIAHLGRYGTPTRAAVWEHNSHLGDARATSMSRQGEYNVGQLVCERHEAETRLIGFTTYSGTVTAAHDWDEPAVRMRVRPALNGSYEKIFHETGLANFLLLLQQKNDAVTYLESPHLERAIGVVYRPDTERLSHYFEARLPQQFNAVIHLDQTQALEPLEYTARWSAGEPEETFPFGV